MTEFEVVVYDRNGNKIKTTRQASDENSLRKELVRSGFAVVSIQPVKSRQEFRLMSSSVRDTELYQLFRELSVLAKSGIKVDRSLQIIINSTRNKKLKEILEKVLESLKAGSTLADAFEKTGFFSPLVVSLIRAAEITGNLSSGFENSANYLKFQVQFKNEIKSAMVYPVFLIFASLFTITVILKFIVPKFFSVFPDIKPENLPVASKIILSLSDLLSLNPVSIAVVAGVFSTIYVLKKQGKLSAIYTAGYYVPVLRDMLININLSRFFYSMYSMLASGIEFIRAVELSSMTVQNKEIRQKIASAVEEIKKGRPISEAFSGAGFLSHATVAMISVGEESGKLEEIFFEIYTIYDENFKNSTKRMLTVMEPLIITITGIIVGFIVISLILTVVTATNVKL